MGDEWRDRAAALAWQDGLLIDGETVAARGRGGLPVISPRDGRVVGTAAAAGVDDIDAAVRSARRSFADGRWSELPPSARGEVLIRFAALVDAAARDLATRISVEMGKPVREALQVELSATARCLRWYGELADKQLDENPVTGPASLALVTREPAGVVGAIVPWNFPLTMTAWKLGPALVAGNSVVLKPAEQTPFSALDLGAIALEAGLPPGVLNVVPGTGPVAGAALGRHPDVDVVAFTGSVEVGRQLLTYAGESNGKRIWPELGGKSAALVLADADVEAAARSTAGACFYNQGQMCSAPSRMIVHRAVADQAIAVAAATAADMWPGDPLTWAAPIGPMVGEAALGRVIDAVSDAAHDGAEIVAGTGQRHTAGSGSYLAPVVLTGVDPHMTIAQREVFGPVLAVLIVDDVDEAVRVANDTRFGLAAAVWTRDLGTAHRVSRQLKAGTVWVNCYEEGGMSMPFGGVKASGFGRDKSVHAIDKYTDLKSTWIEL